MDTKIVGFLVVHCRQEQNGTKDHFTALDYSWKRARQDGRG